MALVAKFNVYFILIELRVFSKISLLGDDIDTNCLLAKDRDNAIAE